MKQNQQQQVLYTIVLMLDVITSFNFNFLLFSIGDCTCIVYRYSVARLFVCVSHLSRWRHGCLSRKSSRGRPHAVMSPFPGYTPMLQRNQRRYHVKNTNNNDNNDNNNNNNINNNINNGTTSIRNMKQEIWLCQFDLEFIVVQIIAWWMERCFSGWMDGRTDKQDRRTDRLRQKAVDRICCFLSLFDRAVRTQCVHFILSLRGGLYCTGN
jgi:hypothetical protein